MLLTFQYFYKKFGIRVLPQLITPHTADVKYLEFPQEAIYHFISYDGAVNGPAADDFLLRNIRHQVPVFQITDLIAFDGNPRHQPLNIQTVIKDYHHTHRHTRPLRALQMGLNDKNTPIVFNYSLLGRLYHYQQSIYAHYYRWRNVFETVMAEIAKTTQENNRQHFLTIEIPRVLPSLSQLTTASKGMTQSMLKSFRDSNSLILLELWKWCTEHRAESAFSKIDPNKLHLVNLIFQEGGQWFVLNLGMLNSWRDPLPEETDAYETCVYKSKQHITGEQLAKRVLRLYISTMELRTLAAKAEVIEAAARAKNETAEGDKVIDDDIEDPMLVDDNGDPIEEVGEKEDLPTPIDDLDQYTAVAKEIDKLADFESLDHEAFLQHIRNEDEQLDVDLRQLDDIANRKDTDINKSKSEVKQIIEERETKEIEKPIQSICDRYVEDGVISPAEHARFVRLASNYKTIPSPDGATTLEKFSDIQPDLLKITPAAAPMADAASVLDKSMLHSSLNELDSRYIETVLHKDYANTVLSVQKAGAAVTNYQVKKSEDVLGAYEEHILKIAPVIGVPSTLRFKVPVVDKDGVFASNGVKYRLRKQRGD